MTPLRLFQSLRSPRHAAADLALLARLAPYHGELPRYARRPARYADDILYALLQVATPRQIEGNRQAKKKAAGAIAAIETIDAIETIETIEAIDTIEAIEAIDTIDTIAPTPPSPPKKEKSPLQKEQEYPHIPWRDLANPDVQTATIIYNDRVNTYHDMQAVERRIEQAPTPQDIALLAELNIRNLQAFAELAALDSGKPMPCRHPLVAQRSLRAQLQALLQAAPDEFLRQHRNTLDNIRRYRRHLQDPRRRQRRKQDQALLEKHIERERVYRELVNGMKRPTAPPAPPR